jgi:hypothetical protein
MKLNTTPHSLLAFALAATAYSAAIVPRASAPEVTIKNGTLQGIAISSFKQEGESYFVSSYVRR